MNTSQKFAAINALAPAALRMRENLTWYVDHPYVDVMDGVIHRSPAQLAYSPDGAIEVYWRQLTEDMPVVVVHALDSARRRKYRWLGYMWKVIE